MNTYLTREHAHSFMMGFICGIGLTLLILLSGCATKPTIYDVQACPPGVTVGGGCVIVKVESNREYEKPSLVYRKTLIDGSTVEFLFNAEDARTHDPWADTVGKLIAPGGIVDKAICMANPLAPGCILQSQ